MLPCQKTCPSYREGCHKTCANWLLFQRRQKEQREAKKAYLRYHMARCTQAVHRWEPPGGRHKVGTTSLKREKTPPPRGWRGGAGAFDDSRGA